MSSFRSKGPKGLNSNSGLKGLKGFSGPKGFNGDKGPGAAPKLPLEDWLAAQGGPPRNAHSLREDDVAAPQHNGLASDLKAECPTGPKADFQTKQSADFQEEHRADTQTDRKSNIGGSLKDENHAQPKAERKDGGTMRFLDGLTQWAESKTMGDQGIFKSLSGLRGRDMLGGLSGIRGFGGIRGLGGFVGKKMPQEGAVDSKGAPSGEGSAPFQTAANQEGHQGAHQDAHQDAHQSAYQGAHQGTLRDRYFEASDGPQDRADNRDQIGSENSFENGLHSDLENGAHNGPVNGSHNGSKLSAFNAYQTTYAGKRPNAHLGGNVQSGPNAHAGSNTRGNFGPRGGILARDRISAGGRLAARGGLGALSSLNALTGMGKLGPRWRNVGWLGALILVFSAFVLLTLRVNTVHSEVRLVERQIVELERQKILLETEFQTRANQRQLSRWNQVEFGYQAPRAEQFLGNERLLAQLGAPRQLGAPDPIRVAMASGEMGLSGGQSGDNGGAQGGSGSEGSAQNLASDAFPAMVSPLTGEPLRAGEIAGGAGGQSDSGGPSGRGGRGGGGGRGGAEASGSSTSSASNTADSGNRNANGGNGAALPRGQAIVSVLTGGGRGSGAGASGRE